MKIHHSPDPRSLRFAAYPSDGDQLDEIWKALDALINSQPLPQSSLDMLAKIKDVKARFPKK